MGRPKSPISTGSTVFPPVSDSEEAKEAGFRHATIPFHPTPRLTVHGLRVFPLSKFQAVSGLPVSITPKQR